MSDNLDKSELVSRRIFVKRSVIAVGAIVFGSLLIEPISQRRQQMTGIREETLDQVLKDQNPTNVQQLLTNFHKAGSPELMSRYVMGFTPIILAGMATDAEGRLAKLKEAKRVSDEIYKTESTNRHRIVAFPACVASHLLPFTKDHDLQYAGELITDAMEFPQREVQEIVPQNLISALTRDEYSWDNLWVTDKVLTAMQSYLSKRHTNPLLCSGSNLTAQFLLYYRLSLASRDLGGRLVQSRERQYALIEKAIKEINDSNDSYAWFVKQWVDAVQHSCEHANKKPPMQRYNALPPQSSELVLGWKNCYTTQAWFPVLASGILNNALLLHLNEEIINGRGRADWFQKEYGPQEATVAFGKGEEWFKKLALHESIFEEALKRSQDPLKTTLRRLADNTAERGIPSTEWDPWYSLVPFRNHLNPLTPSFEKGPSDYEETVRFWRNVAGGRLILGGTEKLLKAAWDYWKLVAKRTPREVEESVRPRDETLQNEMTRREFLTLLLAHKKLVEGDPTEYENLSKGQSKVEDKDAGSLTRNHKENPEKLSGADTS